MGYKLTREHAVNEVKAMANAAAENRVLEALIPKTVTAEVNDDPNVPMP
jgi:ATP-dependent protease HslVU (ClpYQ) ATPase subunit